MIENTGGISCSFLPGAALGVELMTRTPYDNTFDREQTAYFVGPNVHVAVGPVWGTLTLLRQVDPRGHGRLNLDEFEKYEARLIVGWNF